jgi:hypothetical protein
MIHHNYNTVHTGAMHVQTAHLPVSRSHLLRGSSELSIFCGVGAGDQATAQRVHRVTPSGRPGVDQLQLSDGSRSVGYSGCADTDSECAHPPQLMGMWRVRFRRI